MAHDLKKILIPHLTPYNKKRYGENYDGGYVFLEEPFNKSNIVYSYGVGKTVDAICFDLECAKLAKRVYLYDGSIDRPATMKDEFVFNKEFLTPENFGSHISQNHHDEEVSMILKMDIEGSEYSCINSNIELVFRHFEQLSIECHNLSHYPSSEEQQLFFKNILNYYKIVHLHGNNHDFVHRGIPNCLEITFLRNGHPFLGIDKNILPDPSVDFPNNPFLPDIQLDWWINREWTKVYIEAGANDGLFQSRSINLSNDKNYYGILIEPSKRLFEQCVLNRDNGRTSFYNCALVSLEKEKERDKIDLYYSKFHPAMNNMFDWEESHQKEEVDALSLTTILEKEFLSFIDYLFLDVEGYELEVLKGIDFDKISFGEIEIESHHIFTKTSLQEEQEKFEKLLGSQYYLKEIIDGDGLEKFIFSKK
jgi:FkbM family methyltransferase